MKEKLSVRKVYRNAYRYVLSHVFAFLFLTVFYFLGSLLPMFVGAELFKVISPVYTYLFFYFAAGCYYKQQILWDKQIFIMASVRFLIAVALFLTSIVMSSILINSLIYFARLLFPMVNTGISEMILGSATWLLGKYTFIFVLFILFFMVPSFAFVSEITGKNRSLLTTYAKTKGNLTKVGAVALGAFFILLVAMFILSRVNFLITTFVRASVLVYISILYFKMYDFFYGLPQNKREKKQDKQIEFDNNESDMIDFEVSDEAMIMSELGEGEAVSLSNHNKKQVEGEEYAD